MLARRLMLLCLLAAGTAARADDVVVLASGSRIVGAIRQLERGELLFSVAGAGRVEINWRNVESLQSDRRLDIGTIGGERLSGAVAAPSAGKLAIATDTGPRTIDLSDVSRIHPIEATFLERTSGSIDLGLEFLTANHETDWTLNAELSHRTQNYLTNVAIDSLLRHASDETLQRRNRLDIDTRRFLDGRWFALGLFVAEEDRELDLDLRLVAGAAFGRTLLASSRMVFSLYGGLDVAHEEYRGVSDADQNVFEVLGAIEWDWFEIGADLQFLIDTRIYVAPDDGRVRFDLQGSLRHDITANYYLSLNVYESYNSDPPGDLTKSDLGVSLTFGRSF